MCSGAGFFSRFLSLCVCLPSSPLNSLCSLRLCTCSENSQKRSSNISVLKHSVLKHFSPQTFQSSNISVLKHFSSQTFQSANISVLKHSSPQTFQSANIFMWHVLNLKPAQYLKTSLPEVRGFAKAWHYMCVGWRF